MATDKSKTAVSAASMETEIARLVVERQLATRDEVEHCRQIIQQDPDRSLAYVLVEQSVVTNGQIQRIQQSVQAASERQIPGYRILGKLGAGAMATVYKAVQLSLDRVVAIKILPRKLSENAEYVELFYKEGKAAAKLNHPNIVQAIDVGEANGFHYFVMEYVRGHTLYDELAEGKVFTEQEALQVILQIARALKHAHEQGLIHRDVKPKNIMITEGGTAKLADMGLARSAADIEAAQAEAGRAFGTPYYISPEQIRGEVDIDFRADIYSLGATLYHLVTGRVPFEAPRPVAVMQKHLKEPLTPPDHINTKLSAGVGEVVEVMMAKERSRRYASTADMLMDLEAIAEGKPPLQARMQIDQKVLSGLTEGTLGDDAALEATGESAPGLLPYIIILGAALAMSVILNVALLLWRS
ncbi:MAG TPA: serine/threonine-protein kinase [Phycisphaerae bacterium]|nr:serine/threonine-protein kinase [Phycisphaerae bacterium]